MAKSKDPDFIPWHLQKWLDKYNADVATIEHRDGSRVVVVTWFTSEGEHRRYEYSGTGGPGDASPFPLVCACLHAMDQAEVEEMDLFRKAFPTWHAKLIEDPMVEVLETFRRESNGQEIGE